MNTEESLDRVVADYLQAQEAGHAPDRAALLAQHPHLVAQLAAFLDDHERMNHLAANMATSLPPTDLAPELPTLRYVGDYELLAEIARGGMGVVYRARQRSLNRLVAVKMILSGALAAPVDVQRFRSEAEAVANLDHPGIVPIYEVGQHEGHPYFSMKLVEGGSLTTHLPTLRQNLRRGVEIVIQVARAVHFAHQRGILHRDLKPGNILLGTEGQPYVTDFGLARRVTADSELTQSGAIVGSPSYMAPEQARAEKVLTTAVDVYSLGAILYELLAGRPPFQEANQLETLLAVRDREPPRPSQLQPTTPRDLETIALCCLHKDPNRRYESALALADELGRWLRNEPIHARPVSLRERLLRWMQRNPVVASLGLMIVVMFLATLVSTVLQQWKLAQALDQVALAREEADQRLRQARYFQDWTRYVADVDRAHRELSQDWPLRATDILDRHAQFVGRGWEWDWLKSQCHEELFALEGGDSMAWSPDGKWIVVGTRGTVRFHNAATGSLNKTVPLSPAFASVYGLSFNATGTQLVAGTPDRGFQLCDVSTGKVRQLLFEPKAELWSARLSPDGKRLAFLLPRDGVQILDTNTAKVIQSVKLVSPNPKVADPVRAMAWSSSGRLLALATEAGFLDVCESETGKRIARLNPSPLDVWYSWAAFGPTDNVLFAVGRSARGNLMDYAFYRCELSLEKGTVDVVKSFSLPSGQFGRIAMRPDGERFVAGGRNSPRLWGVDGSPLATWRGHQTYLSALAFSPDGKRFASMDGTGVLKVWDATAPTDAWSSEHQQRGLADFAYSPDERLLALAVQPPETRHVDGKDESQAFVALVDAATGKRVRVLETTRRQPPIGKHFSIWLPRVAFSPDGKRLAVVDCDDSLAFHGVGPQPIGAARIYDVASGKEVLRVPDAGEQVAYSPDGRWLATLTLARGPTSHEMDRSAVLHFHDAQTGRRVYSFEDAGHAATVFAFAPDSQHVAVAGRTRTSVIRLGDQSAELVHRFDKGAWSLTFAPSGRWLATAMTRGDVSIWDVEAGRLYARLDEDRTGGGTAAGSYQLLYRTPHWFAFTPDSTRLAYATPINTVRLWHVETQQDVLVLEDFASPIDRLRFSRDGRNLIAVDSQPRWHVWKAQPLSDEQRYGRPARRYVETWMEKRGLVAEVRTRAQDDPDLSTDLRAMVLRLLENQQESTFTLNTLAWDVVVKPGGTREAYARALRQIERACAIEPDSRDLVNTLGVAYYRNGDFRMARETLERSQKLASDAERARAVEDFAFLAMACHRLGHATTARRWLDMLRAAGKDKRNASEQAEYQALLRETETVLGQ